MISRGYIIGSKVNLVPNTKRGKERRGESQPAKKKTESRGNKDNAETKEYFKNIYLISSEKNKIL